MPVTAHDDVVVATALIEVDGVERPACNSLGHLIAANVEALRNFWRWYGDSTFVDHFGRPIVMYHGTAGPSWTEDGTREAFEDRNGMGAGAYFTPIADVACNYALMDAEVGDGSPALIPVYIAMEAPFVFTDGMGSQSISDEQREHLWKRGHDGALKQIKSAVGNSGAFSKDSTSLVDSDWEPPEVTHDVARQRGG